MALDIIGAGFGRTGTMSLKLALERLGFGPCHHMEEVFKHPGQIAHWEAAAEGAPVDWHGLFEDYRASADWPSCHYWRDLTELFPEAKVILTVRSAESWWTSFSQTIMKVLADPGAAPKPETRRIRTIARKIIADETFRAPIDDKAAAMTAFEARIREVRAAIPEERLLVFDVREGWEPLCAFLGCAVPAEDFPRSNAPEQFWQDADMRKP